MMLSIVITRPELRREALKVISIGLTKAKAEQAIEFVDQTRGLAILFGLWMKQPAIVTPLSAEHAKLNEQLISIFWNLMAALA